MTASTLPVQTPLNLFLPIAAGQLKNLATLLQDLDRTRPKPIHVALERLGNVHFAQFILMPERNLLAVLTMYDGEFNDYILSFVEHIGELFDMILKHIEGGCDVSPVQKNREPFLEFIRKHDVTSADVYRSYPGLRVFDIKDALEIA